MTRRTYTDLEKSEAVGLAMAIGPVKAAKQLGHLRRNVSNWQRDPRFVQLKAESREQVADRLWNAVVVGTEEVLKRMQDPDARLADVARALEVVSTQHALLVGAVTSRTETTNVHIDGEFQALTTPDIRAELLGWMRTIENATDADLDEHEAKASQLLDVAGRVLLMEGVSPTGSDATEDEP